jgi:hypothetical protein
MEVHAAYNLQNISGEALMKNLLNNLLIQNLPHGQTLKAADTYIRNNPFNSVDEAIRQCLALVPAGDPDPVQGSRTRRTDTTVPTRNRIKQARASVPATNVKGQ